MPRQARIDIPGLLQHVIVRGVGGMDIFIDDEDREDLYARLRHLLEETRVHCYAWAFLDNHIHLLLLPTEQPLAQLMRRLLTGYEQKGDVVEKSTNSCYPPSMPRQARIDIPGLLQHVIVRGVGGMDIFIDDEDREDLYARLHHLLEETRVHCYAWAFLDNHIHLLLLPTEQPLAQLMRRLLTGYAVSFNRRHNRSGHLFQNRYKSIVCDADSYLLELVRYIHLNPLRAGMLSTLVDLADFRWSGHRQLMGRCSEGLVAADKVLALFGVKKATAISRYEQFLTDGVSVAGPRLSRGGRRVSQTFDDSLENDHSYDDRILGGGDFVDQVLTAADLETVSQASLESFVNLVADHYGLSIEELRWPCRQAEVARAKAVICFWSTRRMRVPGVEVAERLGYSTSAVSAAAKRGKKIIEHDEAIMAKLAEVDL